MIKVKSISKVERCEFNKSLKDLEAIMEYPYGDDFFNIDHGKSYFSFFDRMGMPYFNVAIEDKKVIACACGVLRSIQQNNVSQKAWYLCDLKVHPDYRGQGIAKRLFRNNILVNYIKCPRGYTISMNPSEGKNKVVDVIKKFPFVPLKLMTTLYFFEVSMAEVRSVESDVSKIIGEPLRFLGLAGVKDIVLKSTGSPMPLFHAQYGPMASYKATSIKHEGRYMFCSPENSKLFTFLNDHFKPSATASVLAHRMSGQKWDFILSSDI